MLQIYKSLESGPLQELTLKTLEKGAWINIVDPTPYELKVVSNLTEVDPDFLRSALDDEERSHTDVEENSVMVLTNVPVCRGKDSYDALPLAIIVTDEYIITVCLEETPVITEFNERTSRLFRTYKKTRFLFQILYKSATYFLRYLRQISKLSDEIEDQLRHDMKNSEILRLLELQKGLTYFNAAIRSNGAVLDKLLRMRNNTSLTPILKAYEEDEFGKIWQADTCYLPYITEDGQTRRVYCIMIIDGHSRLLVGGELFYNDNACNFQKVLKDAIATYGIPDKLYVDNGCSYSNEQLSMICVSLGILLLHTKIRDGASKGKVERHFRTLKERWLYTLDISSITSLAQFNTMLKDYMRSYNTTFHRGIDSTPLERYQNSKNHPRKPQSSH